MTKIIGYYIGTKKQLKYDIKLGSIIFLTLEDLKKEFGSYQEALKFHGKTHFQRITIEVP